MLNMLFYGNPTLLSRGLIASLSDRSSNLCKLATLHIFTVEITVNFRLQEYENKTCVDDLCPYVDISDEPLLCRLWHEANNLNNTTSPTVNPGIIYVYIKF